MTYRAFIPICLLALVGCASVESQKSPDAASQNVVSTKPAAKPAAVSLRAERERRKKTVAQEFDAQRDRAQYQAALGRWQQEDVAGCRQALSTLLARNPDQREGHLLAAQVDLFDSKPKSALEHARPVLVAFPNDAEAHYQAALALDAMGQMAAALPHYEQAARLAPAEDAYQASYQAGIGSAIPPPAGGIIAASDGAARADCNNRAAHIAPAAYYDDSNDEDGAAHSVATLRKVAEEHPDNEQAALDAAACALRAGEPQAAVEIATASLRAQRDSAPLLRMLGMAQFQSGDYGAAQASLGRAIALDKSSALAYFLMGSALARMGESQAARPYFDEAARLDPRYCNN
jgi:tetratricopeptide (TPR) repeat protein